MRIFLLKIEALILWLIDAWSIEVTMSQVLVAFHTLQKELNQGC